MNQSPRLIAMTIIKNEENNFLRPWLKNISSIVDYHVFVDDASTDNTPQIVREHLQNYPGQLHCRKTSIFRENEPALRAELWEHVRHIARPGDWILIVDADEFYDEHILTAKKKLLANKYPNGDVLAVACMDMWTAQSYRCDGYWSPTNKDIRLIRYYDTDFGASSTELHQPPYPISTNTKKRIKLYVPKIHFAYLRKSDRVRRYNFYRENVSPDTNSISYNHALSILDKKAKTKKYFTSWRTWIAHWRKSELYFDVKNTIESFGE